MPLWFLGLKQNYESLLQMFCRCSTTDKLLVGTEAVCDGPKQQYTHDVSRLHLKKQPEDDVDNSKDCSPKNSSNCSQTDMYCNETDGSIRQSLSTTGHLLPVQVRAASFPPHAVSPESDLLPNKRARLREVPEDEESSSLSSFTALSPSCSSAKQRSRRRCRFCRTKLELVQQEMGSCRCGFVFCSLHRLPEQHGCLFDHLGHGRQEAVQKVVKLRRKVGRSCQRIGEEFS